MNTESSAGAGDGFGRRLRVHAALGDEVRLRIADRLLLGDASPGELAAAFALTSNLLAHHLRVLEEAGIVRRVRSEGDRRRSYVQLDDDPALLGMLHPTPPRAAPRVVFVCTHNSARSQLAAAAWRQVSDLPVASAGTHPASAVHPGAVAAGRRHGLEIPAARTRQLHDVLHPSDLIVAVCDNAHEELPAELPAQDRLHWAVPDPIAEGTDAAFDAAYERITARVDRLAAALHPAPASLHDHAWAANAEGEGFEPPRTGSPS